MLRLSRLPLLNVRKRNLGDLRSWLKSRGRDFEIPLEYENSPPEHVEVEEEEAKFQLPLTDNVVWSIPKPASGKLDGPRIESSAVSQKLSQQTLVAPEFTPLYDFYETKISTLEDLYPEMNTKQVEMLELHPDIWCAQVDQDVISRALEWQNSYRTVDMSFEQSRLEVGRKRYSKPWQGSGEGFERCRDKTSPAFKGGAFTDEPRRPFISNFHMIDRTVRLNAIIHCLTIKHLQGDLIIVTENLMTNQPTNIPRLAKDINTRNEEELSYMILTSSDKTALSNFAAEKKYFNVFPISGLNVKSLLKYDKLLMDVPTLRQLEARLLFELTRYDWLESHSEPEHPMLNRFWSDVMGKWKDEKFNQGGYRSGHHKFYRDWPRTFA